MFTVMKTYFFTFTYTKNILDKDAIITANRIIQAHNIKEAYRDLYKAVLGYDPMKSLHVMSKLTVTFVYSE